jgi:hypothetical protein
MTTTTPTQERTPNTMKTFYNNDYVASKYAFDTTRKAQAIAESLATAPIQGLSLVDPYADFCSEGKIWKSSFEDLSKLLLALEVDDFESAKKTYKKFSKHIKYKNLNNFFEAKFAIENGDFGASESYFSQYKENPHAKILVLNQN